MILILRRRNYQNVQRVLTIRATLWVSFSKKKKCKNYNAVGNLVGKVPIYYYLGNKNCRSQMS
jgi:hypothetical protein